MAYLSQILSYVQLSKEFEARSGMQMLCLNCLIIISSPIFLNCLKLKKYKLNYGDKQAEHLLVRFLAQAEHNTLHMQD